MAQWVGQQMSGAVWRRILTNHPELVDVFEEGNESVLASARAQRPQLDKALRRLGPPRPELLRELRGGGGPLSRKSSSPPVVMPFNDAEALSVEEMRSFFEEGYVHARGAAAPDLIDAALRHINACLGRNAVEQQNQLTNLAKDAVASPAITDLFYKSKIPSLAQSLVGRGRLAPVRQGQVALRFPKGGGVPTPAARAKEMQRGRAYHVDGFAKGLHSPFTLLVGVCLSDVTEPLQGNFAVHPGAHWHMQDVVKRAVDQKDDVLSSPLEVVEGESASSSKPDLGPARPLLMKRGDVVLAHQKLPHFGQANYGPNVRYQVYFRLRHVDIDAHRTQWLDDLLLPFEGLRAAIPGV
mmetsp:Transcript_32624/g.104026  ORF Transcript_32624/g.104026 Transcript_32624/m.104026 type:complete len:353 (-) Transcript_32624:66-1124(-)|eukprot:CAMPEP_0118919584 /NCGR_PEP_ID=MMETSP1166-20130328/18634_1 /TAXON_ID=1104430 /ORGANISM="Chrysoreinhardia sp, Strain CCMP3193" /LENGTH=352 /DNA_ID=CAMNT_0006860115 /DNA_START=38 /DNA_END=1096 /DNA_ORIENTATION=+